MRHSSFSRRYPVGAEANPGVGIDFRVWAPKRTAVEVVFDGGLSPLRLEADGGGYFRGTSTVAGAATRYRFRLDHGERLFPDPASRSQPDGPHGSSEVILAERFAWSDAAWTGVRSFGHVLYEMHLGTFTRGGTWIAAIDELPELAALGVTILEIMPIAEFPGRFGWGYDGVDLFAPTRLYGSPDDARRFVDAAHALGLGVILDVVYNHLGPDGNYLGEFSDTYVTSRHTTPWGPALNYDGPGSEGVRSLVSANAAYWIDEFHFDGLRLDATQSILDDSPEHILTELTRAAREAARGRGTLIIAENESQEARLVRPVEQGGYALDAVWNDDFHHTARVALTGRSEAYYTDYGGTPQELLSALKWGFLYQGQHYAWKKERRGHPALDLDPSRFVTFLENHDHVANSACGERLAHTSSPRRHRALVAVLLLGPETPLLFQGEEFASSRPFVFFADHDAELAALVNRGRREFLALFPSIAADVNARVPSACDLATFEGCKLELSERASHRKTYDLYRDLIQLRRTDSVFAKPQARRMDGALLSQHALALRFFGDLSGDDRLLLVNLGPDLDLARAPEPLLAPPSDAEWSQLWSSEDPRYGGDGTPPLEREGFWHVPGESTIALRPRKSARD